jgi:hypothetical protein
MGWRWRRARRLNRMRQGNTEDAEPPEPASHTLGQPFDK